MKRPNLKTLAVLLALICLISTLSPAVFADDAPVIKAIPAISAPFRPLPVFAGEGLYL